MNDNVNIHPWTRTQWPYAFMVEHADIRCLSQHYVDDVKPIRQWLNQHVGEEGTQWAFSQGRSVHVKLAPLKQRPVHHMTFLRSRDYLMLYRLTWGGIVDPQWQLTRT